MPEFESAIHRAIARILSPPSHIYGAGFLIARRRLLTCAHVISEALNCTELGEPQRGRVIVDFPRLPGSPQRYAQVIYLDPSEKYDLAILELTEAPPAQARPAPLTAPGSNDFWDHPYCVLGFSDREGKGVWASGRFQGADQDGMIQMASDPGSQNIIQEGFSGAPVWDKQLRAVVGMVSSVIFWSKIPASRPLMLPLQLVRQSWPQLAGCLVRPTPNSGGTPAIPADPAIEQQWRAGQLVEIAGQQYLLKESLYEEQLADPPTLERWYLARPFPRGQRSLPGGIEHVLLKQLLILKPIFQERSVIKQLEEESDLLQRLPSHSIFPSRLAVEAGRQSFTLVQRYPTGKPLSLCFLEQEKPADPFRARQLLRSLPTFCRNLAALHRLGYAHRLLCAQSLLLEQARQGPPVLRLRDLGLATRPARVGEGPPGYAAPEQLYARYHIPGTDIYQLGALLYHLLTGKKANAFLYEPPSPSCLEPTLPPALDPVLMRALAREPARRWPDLVTFANALASTLQDWRH